MISAGVKEINVEREGENKTRTRLVKESAVYTPFWQARLCAVGNIGGVSFPNH